jgi:hypothetical protein
MTQAAQLAQYGANNVGLSFKNRIINGDMGIDQRNNGAAVSNANGYTLDRWYLLRGASSSSPVFNVQQSTTTPPNFTNSLSITVGTSGAPGSGNFSTLYQIIEGFNTADLGFGTATAQTVTLSFWVRSSVTGTFGVAFQNSALNRSYIATYTINAANTWEQKSITITGDTSGTWLTNNGAGLAVYWDLGVGTGQSTTAGSWQAGNFLGLTGGTKLSNTGSATFFITGVQLEKGTVATSFDYLPYGTELALCQRYCYVYSAASPYNTQGGGYARVPIFGNGTNTTLWYPQFPVQLRVCPSLTYNVNLGALTSLEGYNYTTNTATGNISSISLSEGSVWAAQVGLNFASGVSSGNVCSFRWTGTSSSNFIFSAEL